VTVARAGYRIEQNPTPADVAQARQVAGDTGDPRRNPDYLIEGRVFDCSAAHPETSVRSIWSAVRKKIREEQTQRVLLNLEGWNGDLTALRRQFDDWPISGLKEVKAITADGHLIQIDLPRKAGAA
jgi:Contact-dependent growth inhibition CdiA C-terminal domain